MPAKVFKPYPPFTLWPLVLAVSAASSVMAQETSTTWTKNAGVTVGNAYDDNIFVERENRQDDTITLVSPFVDLRGEGERHEIRFHGSAERGRYHAFESENYTDWQFGSEGRFAYSDSGSVFGGIRQSRDHEERVSADAVNGEEPTRYAHTSTFFGVNHAFGDITARIGGTWETLDFDDVPTEDGLTIDNDDRDRDQSTFGGRFGYSLTDSLEPFFQVAADLRRYDLVQDIDGYDRDSQGGNAALGMIYRPSNAFKGEVLAGWLEQDYDDPSLSDVGTIDYGAELTWQPTGSATRLAVRLDRTVDETTIRGASSSLRTRLGASLTGAVRPDLTITAAAGYSDHDYQGVSRNDNLLSLGMGARYYLNPHLFVGMDYEFLQRDSSLPSEDFDRNRITVDIGTQLASGYEEGSLLAAARDINSADGFYFGVQGGLAALGTAQAGTRGSNGILQADFRDAGSQVGVFGGYALELSPWRLGVEAEAGNSQAKWQHERSGERDFSVEKHQDVGLGLRLGHQLDGGHEVYSRFGLARGRFETEYLHDGMDRHKDWLDGRRIGGGIEVPLSQAFWLRMDFTYTDYEDIDIGESVSDDFATEETLMQLGLAWHPWRERLEPTSPQPMTYDGPYVGARLGYGSLITDLEGPRTDPTELEASFGDSGMLAGIFAGYGITWQRFHLAAEVHGEYSDITWNHLRSPTGRTYSVDRESSHGLALRAGYVIDSGALVYVRGGPAWTDFETRYARGEQSIHQSETEQGWQFGGGIEVPLSDSLSLSLEYVQTRYDDYKVNYTSGVDTLENRDSALQVGLGYRF